MLPVIAIATMPSRRWTAAPSARHWSRNWSRRSPACGPGDRLLIVFNGHGSRNRRDPKGNRLWLWNNTSLDVREFDALLTRVPPVVPVRFVFTQCYAGAFARLAPGPDGNRCGFLAESEDREAEGCAAGVDAGDYRDYTTYFSPRSPGARAWMRRCR